MRNEKRSGRGGAGERYGFTIIELLVVISIISLLMAMLLPSLNRARAQAAKVVCGTKIKGLGLALNEYLSEFNGVFPINGLILPKSGVPTMYLSDPRFANAEVGPEKWRIECGALWSYMGGTSPERNAIYPLPFATENLAMRYICPSDSTEIIRTGTGNVADATAPLTLPHPADNSNPVVMQGAGSPGYWSYSVNSVCNSLGRFRNRFTAGGLPWRDPLRQVDIRGSNFIVFIEEASDSLFNDEVFDAPAYSEGDMLTDRHNGGGNIGFIDGHVEFFNRTIFDQVPSGISGSKVSHAEAMLSPYTRMFFPDGGEFGDLASP